MEARGRAACSTCHLFPPPPEILPRSGWRNIVEEAESPPSHRHYGGRFQPGLETGRASERLLTGSLHQRGPALTRGLETSRR
ncbi:MAG: hypothetical protein JRE57_15325 [Deltaproteobacteria bacterium]|nr:hypothetical protein [Deltaproteobacteria bacterium]